jgi:UPF0176 protein
MTDDKAIRVAALYRFAPFDHPAAIRDALHSACAAAGVRGTLLIAREGINGTIAGHDAAVAAILDQIRALPDCAAIAVKDAWTDVMPFHRLKVRLKREIVTMGEPDIDPRHGVGRYVAPAEWNALLDDPDTILIDTRNAYEVAIGSFPGAIDPGTTSFGEFPAWFRAHRDALLAGRKAPRVAMFCTGGIRCEKSTAFLRAEGVEDVVHLEGGILKYLEEIPVEANRWTGECFVFDERVAVGHGLSEGTHDLCRGCRMPVSPDDRAAPSYVEGVSCPRCADVRSPERQAAYAERHRQTRLAAERGETHIGKRD